MKAAQIPVTTNHNNTKNNANITAAAALLIGLDVTPAVQPS